MRGMDYRKSTAWQKSDDLVVLVYEMTKVFPREEMYGLALQMRRAATSIAANIAEGSGRSTVRDYLHFLYQARGSLREVQYYTHLVQRLHYADDESARRLQTAVDEAGRALHGLIEYWGKKAQSDDSG
jgi:four helix bundle protein